MNKIDAFFAGNHVVIRGNEKRTGKRKLPLNIVHCLGITSTVFQIGISSSWRVYFPFHQIWQLFWCATSNHTKLHNITLTLTPCKLSFHQDRYKEVIMDRLRIDPAHLTHICLVAHEPQSRCSFCQSNTIQFRHHLFIEGFLFEQLRIKSFPHCFMYCLFFHGLNRAGMPSISS